MNYSLFICGNKDNYDRNDLVNIIINYELHLSSISYKKEKPNKTVLRLIKESFGSYKTFKKILKSSITNDKNTYTFLVLNNSRLEVINFVNTSNIYNKGLVPLLCINNKLFKLIDFHYVNKLLERFYG